MRIDDAGASGRAGCWSWWRPAPRSRSGCSTPDELAALEALERSELVERRTDGRRRFVDVAHPLHGEAVRARLTSTRREAMPDAARRRGRGARRAARRRLLRIALWRLAAGATGDAGLFARAAARALAALDPALAERLARAAVQAGGGFDGAAAARAGRSPGGARRRGGAAARRPRRAGGGDDRERPRPWRWRRRATCSGRCDRADDADAVLRDAEQLVGDGRRCATS